MTVGSEGVVEHQRRAVELLTGARSLRRVVRAQRRYPARVALGVVGALFLAADVAYRLFPPVGPQVVPGSGGGLRIPREDPLANLGGQPPDRAAAVFWLLAVPLTWAVCAWAVHRRRAGGLGGSAVITGALGMAPFAALAVAEFVLAPRVGVVHRLLDDPDRGVLVAASVAAGLALVAVRERDARLVAVAGLVAVVPALTRWGVALLGLALVLWAVDRRVIRDNR